MNKKSVATSDGGATPLTIFATAEGQRDAIDRFLTSTNVRPNSVETYRRRIQQFFAYLEARKVARPEREHILAWQSDMAAEGKASLTTRAYLSVVCMFFRWTQGEGLYPNIAAEVRIPSGGPKYLRRRDALTGEQAAAMLEGIDRSSLRGLRDYALLSVMVMGGLRCVEASRAKVEDFTTLGNMPVLYVQGKGRDERGTEYVKVTPNAEAALRAYLAARGPAEGTEALFSSISNNSRGRRLSTRSISKIVKGAMQNVGYDSRRLTAHSLRHTSVTLALKGGESLEAVKEFARHENIATTLIYSHAIERERDTCGATIEAALSRRP